MILINIEEKDPSLERVIDWLDCYGVKYQLINETKTDPRSRGQPAPTFRGAVRVQ